jgi:hypothetical protein
MTALSWVRAHRTSSTIVLVVFLVLAALTVVTLGSAARGGDLDPANPARNGAQAVARVLADQGIELTVARNAAELGRAPVDADTTVLVTSTDQLGLGTAREVGARSRAAGALVLAAPGRTAIRGLRLPIKEVYADVERAEAGCDDPLVSGLSLEVGPSIGYRTVAGGGRDPVEACYGGTGPRSESLLVRVDRATPTYAVGGIDLLTNEHVTQADNAAVALRILGQHDRLVWYIPDPRDIAAGDAGSLAAQLPPGLVPALYLTGAAALALLLWRGRRLGPLVTEPLPVVVKAVESTRGRGRLYRRVRDSRHAADVLRATTRRRVSGLLQLPHNTDPERLAEAMAAALGEDPAAVHAVLSTSPVADDEAMVRLAQDLAALERKVHRL